MRRHWVPAAKAFSRKERKEKVRRTQRKSHNSKILSVHVWLHLLLQGTPGGTEEA